MEKVESVLGGMNDGLVEMEYILWKERDGSGYGRELERRNGGVEFGGK